MKLLDEIIAGASSADERLAVLLRKALVLASHLKNETLKDWCSAELDGYPPGTELPAYREFECQSLGFFVGYGGSTMNRQPLALALMKPEHQEAVRSVRILPGVAELEATAESTDKVLSSPWSPNLTVVYQTKFFDGWVLNRAWREFPAARVLGICDTVRNKLLRFALELREEVGDSDLPLNRVTAEQVEAKVVNYIYGGQNVIGSTVGRDLSQVSDSTVLQGNFSTLAEELQKLGIQPKDIEALPDAIKADEDAVAKGDIGAGIHGWIRRAANGALKGANSIAVSTIATAIKHYLGI